MSKNFLQAPKEKFKLAKITRHNKRWVIVYYQTNPKNKKLTRHRETFNLNRIQDLNLRAAEAKKILTFINNALPKGYPYGKFKYVDRKAISIQKAIELARDVKCNTDRPKSADVYATVSRIFLRYLDANHLSTMMIRDFMKIDAFDFMDYIVAERKVGNTTFNNYKTILSSLFNYLVQREYIIENPFKYVPKKPKTEKRRRMFTANEKNIICDHVFNTDPALMLLILLEYHCFIRPSELARLRFYHFNLKLGVIDLEAGITKNRKDATITIPDVILPYLYQSGLEIHPPNWYLFGPKLLPSAEPLKRIHNINDRHRKVLLYLEKSGKLNNIRGLTFYSWKDTGALDLLEADINIMEVMTQLRHSDLNTTQRYLTKISKVNHNIKKLETVRLLPKLTPLKKS